MKRFLQHLCKISRKIDWMAVKRAKKLPKLIIYIHKVKARTFSFGMMKKKVLKMISLTNLSSKFEKPPKNPIFREKPICATSKPLPKNLKKFSKILYPISIQKQVEPQNFYFFWTP